MNFVKSFSCIYWNVVQSLSHAWLFATPWTAACQSIEMLICLLFFNLLMWYNSAIDLQILKTPCILGINPIWSECMTFLIYCWIQIASILIRNFGSMFINDCCSVTQLCPTFCDTIDWSTPGYPVLHYLLEYAQIHVHWISDAIQPSNLLLSPSPLAFNLSQHQGLFHWVDFSCQVAKVLEIQLQ